MLLVVKNDAQPVRVVFQRAPTLGGECYADPFTGIDVDMYHKGFQRAPTLGGECYGTAAHWTTAVAISGFKGHPPLGVNATRYVPC